MKRAELRNEKQPGWRNRRKARNFFPFPEPLRLLLPLFFCLFFLYPATLPAALVNGDFSNGLTGWEAIGSVYPADGVAVMTEGEEANPASLVQTFELKPPTPSLSVSLAVKLMPNGDGKPSDGFQVFLLDGAASLVGAIADIPGELLWIQPDGTIHYASKVSIAGAPASGSVWSPWPADSFVMNIDLSEVTATVRATLAFDLTHFGDDRTSEARIDNVQTLAMPTAVNDAATIDEDVVTDIAVLANDSDPDGPESRPDPATALLTIVTLPAHGTAAVQTDGTIRYTPAANFSGTDAFTYKIRDASGYESGTATVLITINGVNDPPGTIADTVTTDEDIPVTIDVLANDTDVEGPLAGATVAIVISASHGSLQVQTDGKILYTPDADYSGADSFTYTVTDSAGGVSAAANVTITVNPVNDMPVARGEAVTTNEDTVVTIAVMANDTDAEGSLALATITIAGNPTNGAVSVQTDKTVLYTPYLNFFGSDSFTYTLTDSEGGVSSAATVTITVNAVNDPPAASAGADQAVYEGLTVALDGSLSSDPENALSYAWSKLSGPEVTLSDASAVKPTFSAPSVGAAGELFIFQLKVTDSGQLEAVDTVSVQITDFVKACDVNDNKQVNLADAVLVQKVLARISYTATLNIAADADGDGRLGIAEMVCALQSAAALRNVPDHDGDGDGYTPAAGDCDDGNPSAHPGATESCNGRDDNCNGLIDEGVAPQNTYYLDADSDGYGAAAFPFTSCAAPYGFVSDNTDSNDADGAVH